MATQWHQMTALELGRNIEAGSIDPRELTEYFLSRSKVKDVDKKIYIHLTCNRAESEAIAAWGRARRGLRRGPLDGVPMSWKDLIAVAGETTTAGSQLFAQLPPARVDATLLGRATRAGMVCLGRTNLPEFAFSALGINPHYGTPENPFDSEHARVPGGSSSGAAVSVARGLAPAGIGSDTGGSVRVPAAWNNLVGLKTTFGALPNEGVLPLVRHLDTVGPLTKDVGDAAAIYSVLAGEKVPELLGASVKNNSFLLPKMLWRDIDPDVSEIMNSAALCLESAGAKLHKMDIPELDEVTSIFLASGDLFSATAYAQLREKIESQPDLVYDQILIRLKLAEGSSAVSSIEAWNKIEDCALRYRVRVSPYTAVVCPTTPILPPFIRDVKGSKEAYAQAQRRIPVNTRIANLFGLCAVTVPAGFSRGLPVGLMICGLPNQDRYILRVAKAIETALSETT